jgi:hypothetical protein
MDAKIAGWALLTIGILFLLWTARLDRRLQQLRAPGLPAAAYLGPIGRWRRELYRSEGQAMIGRIRWAFATFCVASLLGALVLSHASE